MIGCISIEYIERQDALPAILGIVEDSDLPIHGLRAIPINQSDKATLSLDLGFPPRSRLAELSGRLTQLDVVTHVVHVSTVDPRAG